MKNNIFNFIKKNLIFLIAFPKFIIAGFFTADFKSLKAKTTPQRQLQYFQVHPNEKKNLVFVGVALHFNVPCHSLLLVFS